MPHTASQFPRVIPTFNNLLDASTSRAGLYNIAKRAQSWIRSSRQTQSLVLTLDYDVDDADDVPDPEVLLYTMFNEPARRVIAIYCKQPLELRSLLEQVRGGPLEKVHRKINKDATVVELHFLNPRDAQDFYNYATKTPFFLVNGSHLWVEWDVCYKKQFSMPMLVPPFVLNQITTFGASRCLLVTRPMFNKSNRRIGSHMFYPQPAKNFLCHNLNFDDLKRELEQYGSIVDITPMVSVNVSFCVHFADIRAAIVAKKDSEKVGSPMHKVFSGLKVTYYKDPCDQRCYVA